MQNHYEIHVTVKDADPKVFETVCKDIGVKPVLLHLQMNLDAPVSDMMTSSRFIGGDTACLGDAVRIASQLTVRGLTVVRSKIETWPQHPLAQSAIMHKTIEGGRYFECHIPVSCTQNNIPTLQMLATEYGAHLSRNVFKMNPDGSQVVMMTLRKHDYSKMMFEVLRDIVVFELHDIYKFKVGKIETEFVLYDSNESHDDAWITQ